MPRFHFVVVHAWRLPLVTVVSEGLTGNVPATVENRGGGPGGEGGARGDRGLPAGPGVRILAGEDDSHAASRAAEPSEQVIACAMSTNAYATLGRRSGQANWPDGGSPRAFRVVDGGLRALGQAGDHEAEGPGDPRGLPVRGHLRVPTTWPSSLCLGAPGRLGSRRASRPTERSARAPGLRRWAHRVLLPDPPATALNHPPGAALPERLAQRAAEQLSRLGLRQLVGEG